MTDDLVVTPVHVTKAAILELIHSWGGKWINMSAPEAEGYDFGNRPEEEGHGFIDPILRDPAKIYVYVTHNVPLDYSEEEIKDLTRILSSKPMSVITIGVSSDPGSQTLAQEFAKDVINRWGGLYNYEGPAQV